MTDPRAFLQAPNLHPSSVPPPRALEQYDPARHVPPTPPMATLKVTPKGTLHLHTSLRQALGLQRGQPIDLVPPVWNSLYWHLDLRPEAHRRVVWHANTPGLRAECIKLPPGLVIAPLTLYLLPGEPAYPNYYPLLASNAFAPDPSKA